MPECFFCGEEEEEFYYVIHIGTFYPEAVYACKECKQEELVKEINKFSLCSTCKNKDCQTLLYEQLLRRRAKGILFITECELYEG